MELEQLIWQDLTCLKIASEKLQKKGRHSGWFGHKLALPPAESSNVVLSLALKNRAYGLIYDRRPTLRYSVFCIRESEGKRQGRYID